MPSAKKAPDWAKIEEEYRAGILSIRSIARRNGLKSHGAISKRAKERGWTRKLAGAVRAKARHQLKLTDQASDATQEEIIDSAAKMQVGVVQTHRNEIGELRNIAGNLRNRLVAEMEILDAPVIDEKGQVVEQPKIQSLLACTHIFESLSRAVAKLVPLERQAFSIREDRAEAPSDMLPLEERLVHYEREDTVAQSDNVVPIKHTG